MAKPSKAASAQKANPRDSGNAPSLTTKKSLAKSSTKDELAEARDRAVRRLETFSRPSRVVIDRILPSIEGGRFAAKRFLDQPIVVTATLLIDGHDHLQGRLLYRHESETAFQSVQLTEDYNDQWWGEFQATRLGLYFVQIEAQIDRFDTWSSDIQKKLAAGQNVQVDLQAGIQLLESWTTLQSPILESKIKTLKEWSRSEVDLATLEQFLEAEDLIALSHQVKDTASIVKSAELPIQVEPKLARFSSWYEFFPRSTVNGTSTQAHGTFCDAEGRLEYVKKMGFNVLYFPPIHPIGHAFRKGKNNTLTPDNDDVGSPWAIGGKEGGHKAIHPALGNFEDFDRLLKSARGMGIELALDIAFQCSPDHPYVNAHPEWFKKRPDGTIQYAENPPKKYQDIYPFDFECESWRTLWAELLSVVQFWVDRGVKVFRVDNPHTKALHFWEWLIQEIRTETRDVIFLAEAFTKPHLMGYLAKAGFSQSYTYFSWRNSKFEITKYLTELTESGWIDYFGANFWPNTPDILPKPLQVENRAIYMQRLLLAGTLSSSYGIYGPVYELMDHQPVREKSEEYLDSEKYQLRNWDLNKPGSLAPLIEKLNQIRNEYPALQSNDRLKFHSIGNENLIAYSKAYPRARVAGAKEEDRDFDRVLVVVNLDASNVQSGMVELPLKEWGIDPDETFQVHDLLTGARYFWKGWRNYVELNPNHLPAHIFVLRRHRAGVNTGAADAESYI